MRVIVIFFTFVLIGCNSRIDKIKILNEISSHNVLELEQVGYANQQSLQFERFQKLKDIYTFKELSILIKEHKSPVVRLYAYFTIEKMNKTKAIPLKKILQKDTTTFIYLENCIGTELQVNKFLLMKKKLT